MVCKSNAADRLKLHYNLDWNEAGQYLQISETDFRNVPFFIGANYPAGFDYLPVFQENINLSNSGKLHIEIINAIYAPLSTGEIVDKSGLISEVILPEHELGYIKKRPVATVSFVPIRKNSATGEFEKLIEFDLEIYVTPDPQYNLINKRSNTRYAQESVLKSNQWFKVSVTQDGLHKMDYTFLKNLGIDVDNINPRDIRVYGNGGGMLPEENADFRHDDLVENPIIVIGENDGVFNTGDYVLFYGQGPHRWKLNESDQRFYHQYNIYSEYAYYFITTDKGAGKRITQLPSLLHKLTTVTTFDDYAFHEKEERNLIQSGREFYGDYFNFNQTSKSFPFNFPNLDGSVPVFVKTSFAGRSTTQSVLLSVVANGQTISTHSMPKVGNSYTSDYAKTSIQSGTFSSSSDLVNVTINLTNASSLVEAWLSYIEVIVRRRLTYSGGQMFFRDLSSVGTGNIAEFILKNANANTRLLDVTNAVNVRSQQVLFNSGEIRFSTTTDTLKEFLAYDVNGSFPAPGAVGAVANQNLHGIGQPDMVIVAHPSLLVQAETLANHHRNKNNLTVSTVNVDQIYNEFSSGAQDISAIRDFMKMLYDRAGSDESLMPGYLLLFGDGSYDYKGIQHPDNNTNFVPTYQSYNSVSVTESYVSDDYFGFLDDNEGGSIVDGDKLDIAIGRLPATNPTEAQNMVSKIIHYQSTATLGSWRNNLTFVGDDEDGNVHLTQANNLASYFENNHRSYNVDKIYLDAYPQQSTSGGSRYPDVKDAINKKIFSGTLIMNYTGHGGVNGWAHERVLDNNDINSWENFNKLPLFITATCEFSKFDDPNKVSSGELVLLNPKGGAIAMVTTVRLVYSGANFTINNNFLQQAFTPYQNRMPTIGEAVMNTKNLISGDVNNRKFIILGDPAVTLAYPRYDVVTNYIDDPATVADDTLKALKKVTIAGEVRNDLGQKMSDFNGVVFPTIFDKYVDVTTLKNDPGSNVTTFKLQKNIIYKGKATVSGGDFSFTFVVPKDISYSFGEGKVSYYAYHNNGLTDANGYSDVIVGGTASDFEADNTGPDIDLFMNDEKFVFGGMTDENPLLIVKLADFSGINTVGTGIGHDITAILDEDTKNTLVLNEYYEAELDNYQKGVVEYPLSELESGRHSLKVKAWDVHNNSGEGYTEFVVAESADLALSHVLNYPNPFTTNTNFFFEHNRPGQALFVQVKIMTVSGRIVKTIQEDVITDGFRVDNISWNGLDDYGDKIGRGVYIYKLNVRTPDGSSAHEFEKLVILR